MSSERLAQVTLREAGQARHTAQNVESDWRIEVRAPRNDMGPDYRAHIIWTAVTGEGGKFTDIDLIGAPGFRIRDVGEPFDLGRHLGQTIILARR